MNLQEIVDEIGEKYPSGLSTASIVRKVDNLQKRLFRKYNLLVLLTFEIIADQALYPIAIPESKIRQVLVDGVQYEHKRIEGLQYSKYIYFIEGGIGIYPTPTKDGTLSVYGYKTPTTLVSTNLSTQYPNLDEDYRMLLVYGVCKEIAENYQDFDMVNGFISQYNPLLDDLLEENQDMTPVQIQEEVWWT